MSAFAKKLFTCIKRRMCRHDRFKAETLTHGLRSKNSAVELPFYVVILLRQVAALLPTSHRSRVLTALEVAVAGFVKQPYLLLKRDVWEERQFFRPSTTHTLL